MILRLLFLVLLALLVAALRRAIRQAIRPRPIDPPRPPHRSAPPRLDDRMVRDPVCGTFVARSSALGAGGEFFCSEGCRSRFLAGR